MKHFALIVLIFTLPGVLIAGGKLTAGWDSRLGDQWGFAAHSSNVLFTGTVGGFIQSGVADDASSLSDSAFNSRYGTDAPSDPDVLTYNLSIAYVLGGDPNYGTYLGVGFSVADLDLDADLEVVSVSGTATYSTGDVFIGWYSGEGALYFDIRFGYGFGLDNTGKIRSTVGGSTFTFDFADVDNPLEGFFGVVTLGYGF